MTHEFFRKNDRVAIPFPDLKLFGYSVMNP